MKIGFIDYFLDEWHANKENQVLSQKLPLCFSGLFTGYVGRALECHL